MSDGDPCGGQRLVGLSIEAVKCGCGRRQHVYYNKQLVSFMVIICKYNMFFRVRILSQCALVSDNKAGCVKNLSVIDRNRVLTCVHSYKYYVFTRARTLMYVIKARRTKSCSKVPIS